MRKGQFITVDITDNEHRNEKTSAWDLLKNIEKGSLVMFDLGYFGFHWFDELTNRGIFYISRYRQKTSFEKIHTYYTNGQLKESVIWLGKYRADKAEHAVRLIEVYYKGVWHQYITNILDPAKLSARDVVQLYSQRWDIELAFKQIKRVLGLSTIWSSNYNAIRLQVYGTLLISHIVRDLRTELAKRANVAIDDVSEELMVKMIPFIMREGYRDPFEVILRAVEYGGVIRPSKRKKYEIEEISDRDIQPIPQDIILKREPRYAEKGCISR